MCSKWSCTAWCSCRHLVVGWGWRPCRSGTVHMTFVCIVCSLSHHDCVNARWKENSSSEMRDLRIGPLSEDTKWIAWILQLTFYSLYLISSRQGLSSRVRRRDTRSQFTVYDTQKTVTQSDITPPSRFCPCFYNGLYSQFSTILILSSIGGYNITIIEYLLATQTTETNVACKENYLCQKGFELWYLHMLPLSDTQSYIKYFQYFDKRC